MSSSEKSPRHHDLDALRAFAMLLGIVLHGLLSFIDVPIWPAQDVHRNMRVYGFFQHGIHGFRMALFFLISGFFTCMLWRKRGLRALIKHRIKRILKPLAICTVLTWPLMIGLGIWGGATKAALPKSDSGPSQLLQLAEEGNLAAMRQLAKDGEDLDQRDAMGTTPLIVAALRGQAEMIDFLVQQGAKVEATTLDGSTPLHIAALFGRVQAVKKLLEHGSDATSRNQYGGTALDNARADWGIVHFAARALQVPVHKATMQPQRDLVVSLLVNEGDQVSPVTKTAWHRMMEVVYIGAMIPAFHHLWFLYYLLWLLLAFVVVVCLKRKLAWLKFAAWLTTIPGVLLVWLPLTFLAQLMMRQSFGPDTAAGLIPWPPKLLYYGLFFAFGALCYGCDQALTRVGQRWIACLVFALPLLFLGINAFESQGVTWSTDHLITTGTAVLYAWLMIFGFLGLFQRFFVSGHPGIRYVSDASYWLYVAHLPVIITLQIWVSLWPWPSVVKLLFVCGLTYVLLILIYRYAVRYTAVGTMLNGPKKRAR